MQVTIRKATVDDAKIISFIGVSSWQAAYRGIIPDSYLDDLSVEQREKHLIQSFKNPNIYFAIAEIESHAVGMICFHPSYHETSEKGAWEVGALYILPQYWNKGIGRSLIQYAFQFMRENDISVCDVWVLEDNKRARSFYEHMGLIYTGIQKALTIGGKELVEVCYTIAL